MLIIATKLQLMYKTHILVMYMTERMPARFVGGLLVLTVLALAVTLLIRSGDQSVQANGGLKVVAAENFWGNIASQIGGSHVQVTSIITNPNADPHLYESNAQNAEVVSTANVVIVNGVGYDEFMNKLLSVSKNNNRQVLTVASVLNIAGKDPNPHLWYDIPLVSKVADQIAASFEAKDSAHELDYQHNLYKFNQSLQPLINTINQIKKQYSGQPVAYTERVPGYLLKDAGLSVKTPTGFASAIEDGTDPSPADNEAMDNLMRDRAIKVLLYNSQTTSTVTQAVRNLATKAGIPVIGVTETLPAQYSTYQSWQQGQLNEILNALKTGK
jgi:zinc/manganese transport system substrate-binding protein